MIEIYTDGCCRHNPGDGAWGFVVVIGDSISYQKGESKKSTTNNEMELTAIYNALLYIRDNAIEDAHIYSDSEYSVNAINIWYANWIATCSLSKRKHIPLLKKIQAVKGSTQIHWVKGHSKNRFNIAADTLVNGIMDDISNSP